MWVSPIYTCVVSWLARYIVITHRKQLTHMRTQTICTKGYCKAGLWGQCGQGFGMMYLDLMQCVKVLSKCWGLGMKLFAKAPSAIQWNMCTENLVHSCVHSLVLQSHLVPSSPVQRRVWEYKRLPRTHGGVPLYSRACCMSVLDFPLGKKENPCWVVLSSLSSLLHLKLMSLFPV